MKRNTKKKTHHIFIALFIFLMLLFAIFGALWFRSEINNTEKIASYRVSCIQKDNECEQYLKEIFREEKGIRLYSSTSHSHLYLRLASSEETAQTYGFSLEHLTSGGYMITRQGNGLYLLAKKPKGLYRAMHKLLSQFTDDSGMLLLEYGERFTDSGTDVAEDILIGERSLNDYSILYNEKEARKSAFSLRYYLSQIAGITPVIKKHGTENGPVISLTLDRQLPEETCKIHVVEGNLYLTANTEDNLKKAIELFVSDKLGFLYPGTSHEQSFNHGDILRLPENTVWANEPWIAEREAIVTLWNINYSRGTFLNHSTSLKTDIMSFSKEQLYNYVRMLKYCGFTGIQVTDMCSAWSGAGGYEYVHERLRLIAEAAHSLDMKFTLWVWGSEFTGYGWVDNSVTYSYEGYNFAYENPDVIATFEKYYSRYAELADCCDRVIAHFYDPGNLVFAEDVAFFSKMLRDKFTTINPDIDFGISCWVDNFDKNVLLGTMGSDVTLYETGYFDRIEDRGKFRAFCRDSGCRLGTWAWNTCEMEIDQLAQMNFNPHIIQETYRIAADYDNILKPSYWSEMDSNHVINVFSLYCAGQMLIDPNRTPEEVTQEIALAAVGPEYADSFSRVLQLIESARSGETRDTYIWSKENYLLKSPDYPAETILKKSEESIQLLNQMITENVQTYTLPLPISLTDLLQLIVPQLEQIKSFAAFRIGLEEAEAFVAGNASKELVQEKLNAISIPVSEYNTVTGLWGQIEARAQQELLSDFCEKYDYELPVDPTFHQEQLNRIYDYFVTYQKGHQEPVLQYSPYFQYGVAYGMETTKSLVNELVKQGLFSVDEATGGIYVTDWEHYKYAFN